MFYAIFGIVEAGRSIESSNSNLQILRFNQDGVSPDFAPQVTQYYLTTEKDIKSLNITAIPENENATVTITGNENFKMGNNTVVIKVTSQDNTTSTEYKINVTKVTDIEKSNTNLETLAISQAVLTPEFENRVTNYEANVDEEVEEIEILAVPENKNATATIEGNKKIAVGDNYFNVIVTAEDGITKKNYKIIVHRRSKAEQQQTEEEQKIQSERVSQILEEKQKEEVNNQEQRSNGQNNKIFWLILIPILILGIFIVAKIIIKNKH